MRDQKLEQRLSVPTLREGEAPMRLPQRATLRESEAPTAFKSKVPNRP